VAFAGALCSFAPTAAQAVSSTIVISQVYGAGGNSGATYRNDYVELFNRGTTTVDVSTWSIQYAATAGTTWLRTNLTGTIAPGHYYLVQLFSNGAVGLVFPAPDVTGTTDMAAANGKVALVNNQTIITSGTSCPTGPTIVDFTGYGTANCFEGAGAAPAISATTSDSRKCLGYTDTDNNSGDFTAGAPNPRNTSSGGVLLSINDVAVTEGGTAQFTLSLTNPNACGVTVNYQIVDGTATVANNDYVVASGTLNIGAGTSLPLNVQTVSDTKFEPNETYFVNLSNAVNATISDPQGQGTINNDDVVPTIFINDVKVGEGSVGTTNAVFTVNLSNTTDQTVTMNYQTADGSATVANNDYMPTSGTLTIPPKMQFAQFTVVVNGDTKFESSENYFVNLSSPVNAVFGDNQGVGTISNDDGQPNVSIDHEGGGRQHGLGERGVHGAALQHHRPEGVGRLPRDRRHGDAGEQRLPAGERHDLDPAQDADRHDHGGGQRRHQVRAERGFHRQAHQRHQRHDHGLRGHRHDLERRRTAVDLNRRRQGGGGQRGHHERGVHGQPDEHQRPEGVGRLPDRRRVGHRRQQRLPAHRRDALDPAQDVDGDDHRGGER
jgi:hypothetical protein